MNFYYPKFRVRHLLCYDLSFILWQIIVALLGICYLDILEVH
jgi:hypothetical protein